MRGIKPWFLAAWVFLIVVVAFGFFIQARTINSLRETQRVQHALICQVYKQDVLDQYGFVCP